MLVPIQGKVKRRKITTYDLEWRPDNLELRLVGVYDERGYRCYYSIKDFLNHEMTYSNRGRIFYAHAGGSYDIQFVLKELRKASNDRFEISIGFSGSRAFMVQVRQQKHKWTFADSFLLLPRKLKDIGKWIGSAKGELTDFYAPMAELINYNAQDCKILYQAIDSLQDELISLGGELKMTLASCAMALFRRKHLNREIRTNAIHNIHMQDAYFASRVEVFERDCKEALYYDINSSFPHSMAKPQPGNYLGPAKKLPDALDALFIAECEIEIKDVYLPPTPYRSIDKRILFPTGKWEAMLDVTDVRLLLENGHKIHKVNSVHMYEPFTDLSAYVSVLYELKRTSEGFKREVYKLLLNGLYGKFGERPEKEKMLLNPFTVDCPHDGKHVNDECMAMIYPGVWKVDEVIDIPHAHIPIGAHITALSRELLFNHLKSCSKVFYCDTDSVLCSPDNHFPESDSLGELKLEYTIASGKFISPKMYDFQTTEGKDVTKAKGFSGITHDDFVRLTKKGETREYFIQRRMARVKECFAKGFSGPTEISVKKRIIGANPKRHTYDDGSTRPWTIEELYTTYESKYRNLLADNA